MPAEPSLGEFRYVFYVKPGTYDKTVAFYRDTLGLPVVGGFTNGTYIGCGSGIVEIIDGTVPTEFQELMRHGVGDYKPARGGWLMIEVESADAAYEKLAASGAEIIATPTDYPWRFRHITAVDPSGNIVSLFHRLPGWEEHHSPPA